LDSPSLEDDDVAQLRELETSVIGVLTMALSCGRVHIVTNAETGWVQLSAQKFIPAVVPLLGKVNIISARSTFEKDHPGNALKWKFFAFQENLYQLFDPLEEKISKNILSFGDSHVEREAVRAVTRGWANSKTKSVKFTERPSMEQLRRQIDLITNCFHHILSHDGDLDLQLTVTINTNTNTLTSPTTTTTTTTASTATASVDTLAQNSHDSDPFRQTSPPAPAPSAFTAAPTSSYTSAYTSPFASALAGRCGSSILSEHVHDFPMPIAAESS